MPINTSTRSTFELVSELWKRRQWIFIASFIAIFSVVFTIVYNLPKLYQSTATVLVGQDNISDSFIKSSVSSDLGTRLQVIKYEIMSRSRLEEVINRFNLYPEIRQVAPIEVVAERMRKDIQFKIQSTPQQWGPENTVAFSLSYQGFDPELVAQVTNTLTSSYLDENNRIRGKQASATTTFLEKGVNEAKVALKSQQRPVVRPRAVVNPAVNTSNVERTVIIEQLTKLKQELAVLRSRYTEKYPDVIRVKNEVARMEQELLNKPAVVVNVDTRVDTPVAVDPLEEASEDRYLSLLGRYEDAQLAEILEQQGDDQFRILEPAVVSDIPVEPQSLRLLIMGLVLSLVLAAGIVLLTEQFDHSFHTDRDLKEFTRVPILVSIPRIETTGDKVRHLFSFGFVSLLAIAGIALLIQGAYMVASGNEALVWFLAQTGA